MKIMFTVQGEGRGHMTQAVAMSEILQKHNHQLVAVLAGGDSTRSLPSFIEQAFDAPLQRIASPTFTLKNNRGISLFASGINTIRKLPEFRKGLATIAATIAEHKPDLIVNFFEPLMGVFNLLYRPATPTLAVGHQFMMHHAGFLRVSRFPMQQLGMSAYLMVAGAGSSKLALSFYPDRDVPDRRITVCPPILRRQLFTLTPKTGQRLLVYVAFHGFSKDIIEWHSAHPEIPIDCFYDKPGTPMEEHFSDNLVFHRLDGEKFLRMMAEARAVVCTAGVESVSEAGYLGKPLLVVPVENHLEQFLNANDAEMHGLAIWDERFALSRVIDATLKPAGRDFQNWVNQAETIMLQAIQTTARSGTKTVIPAEESLMARALAE